MVRIFKKPELRTEKAEFSEDIFQDPKKLKEIKEHLKPEVYLKSLYEKIGSKEKEWETRQIQINENWIAMDKTFQGHVASLTKELKDIENALVFKREESAELEKPLTERIKAIDAREQKVIQSELDIKTQEQAVFEKERATEAKLDSIKDLSDELAEMRVRLNIREKQHASKEASLKTKEMEYLVAVQNLKENEKNISAALQNREYAVSLKELGVQSREENLIQREQKLSEGHIWLNDQRGVLERAWAELKRKSTK
jgi:hypothetical protein